jgi:hypothetical protein
MEWRAQSPYSKVDDFVFPSLLKNGKVPIWASTIARDFMAPTGNELVPDVVFHDRDPKRGFVFFSGRVQ